MVLNENRFYQLVRERLKERRRQLSLTQAQLADRAMLQRTTVANIEVGQQNLPLHVFYQLCEALETDAMTILPSPAEVVQPATSISAIFDGAISEINDSLPKTAGFVAHMREKRLKAT